jgi:hypothetical protein
MNKGKEMNKEIISAKEQNKLIALGLYVESRV